MLRGFSAFTYDTPRCVFFERGHCRNGNNCQFLHIVEPQSQPTEHNHDCINVQSPHVSDGIPGSTPSQNLCQHYFTKGWCGYGNNCRFSHAGAAEAAPSVAPLVETPGESCPLESEDVAAVCETSLGKPFGAAESFPTGAVVAPPHETAAQKEQKTCKFFRAGYCHYGRRCRFRHEDISGKKPVHEENDGVAEPRSQTSRLVTKKRANKSATITKKRSEPHAEVTKCSASNEGTSCSAVRAESGIKAGEQEVKVGNPVELKLNNEEAEPAKLVANEHKVETLSSIFSDETLVRMRDTEIQQVRRRYPKLVENKLEDGSVAVKFVFEPSDPDWPYDVKQMNLEVVFPPRYPDDKLTIELSDNERIPGTVARCINILVQDWVTERHAAVNSSMCKELTFRPLMMWLDRNAEDLFTIALKEYKRELMAQAAGVQFIPATKLRQLYPEAAKTAAVPAGDQPTDLTTVKESSRDQESQGSGDNIAELDTDQTTADEGSNRGENDDRPGSGSGKAAEDGNGIVMSTNPARKGTEVSLTSLQLLDGTATLIVSRLTLIVTCSRCTNNTELQMAPGRVYTASCTRCHNEQLLEFSACIAHQMASVVGYLNLNGCRPFDVVLADCQFQIGCISCSKETFIDSVSPGQLNSTWCLHCHQKLTVRTECGRFVQLTPTAQLDTSKVVRLEVKGPIKSVRDPAIQEGQPLPNNGTCRHFKKSFRWLRFPCCGKAYPCDHCHDEKELDHVMKRANRMICGFCAKEQSYAAERQCIACSSTMTNKSTDHWEGGKGCRDKIKMNRTDIKKYANINKTVSHTNEQKVNTSKKTTKLRHVV